MFFLKSCHICKEQLRLWLVDVISKSICVGISSCDDKTSGPTPSHSLSAGESLGSVRQSRTFTLEESDSWGGHSGGVAVAEEDDWLIINLSILQRDEISNMCIWILHTILTFATRGSLRWVGRACKTISTFTASWRQGQVKDWMQFDWGTTYLLG